MKNKKKEIATLCMIHQHSKILLGLKKRGFATGRWNGFGGKVKEGESIEEAAIRELFEEAGIKTNSLSKIGILDFEFLNGEDSFQVHIFKANDFIGEPMETEEMKPQWFHVDEIPFMQMWSDDLYWMPLFLKGKKFKGRFLLDKPVTAERQAKILDKELIEVDII